MGNIKPLHVNVTVTTKNGIENKTINFVKQGCKLFFNAQHLLLQLNSGERAFYDFLQEKMVNKNNTITINAALKNDFIAHIAKITSNKTIYKLQSLSKYTKKLEGLGLIISMSSSNSGFFSVNPKYAFKGTEKQREATLKSLIESRNKQGLLTNMLASI